MSKKVQIEWDRSGTTQLLKGPRTAGLVGRVVEQARANAGEEFTTRVNVGSRARAYLVAQRPEARRKNAREHTLQRAVGQVKV